MAYQQEKGASGERLAAAHLERSGYRILAGGYRAGHREIDLVARRDDLVVFVEVKSRSSESFAPIRTVIDRRKQENLIEAAREYISGLGALGERLCYRFDVILLIAPGDGRRTKLEHIEDAFRA